MNRLSQLFAAVATAALVATPYALAQLPSAHSHDSLSAKTDNSPLIERCARPRLDSSMSMSRFTKAGCRGPHVSAGLIPARWACITFC